MKKKIIALAITAAMLAVAAIGMTVAYLTSTDQAVNTFTVGNVDITLNETFIQNSKLVPGKNIEKIVNVTNNKEAAYVRLHIAFPADTFYYGETDGVQEYNNLVHFNQRYASLVSGEWNWCKAAAGVGGEHPGYPGNGTNYNTYTTSIGGKEYRVFVVTYMTVLGAGDTTETDAMYNVYLDKYADSKDGVSYTAPVVDYRTAAMTADLSNYKIHIIAEGVQAEGFSDAYTALNTAFGTPGSTGYVSPFNK